MAEQMLAGSGHLRLVPLDPATARSVAAGRRVGHRWAPDFPAEGDVVVSSLVIGDAGISDEPGSGNAEPWRWPWLVVLDGVTSGTVGFMGSPEHGRLEIGYGIVPSARGRGHATQAVHALLGKLDRRTVREVVAETAVGNAASERVLQKVGFSRTGQRDDAEDGPLTSWTLRLHG